MISRELKELQDMQKRISDICSNIHDYFNKEFELNCNILVRYEPTYDDARLNMTLVYFNRNIAEYVYIIDSNRFGCKKADFNSIDSNGNKFKPLSFFEAFESCMKNKLNAELIIDSLNHKG